MRWSGVRDCCAVEGRLRRRLAFVRSWIGRYGLSCRWEGVASAVRDLVVGVRQPALVRNAHNEPRIFEPRQSDELDYALGLCWQPTIMNSKPQ